MHSKVRLEVGRQGRVIDVHIEAEYSIPVKTAVYAQSGAGDRTLNIVRRICLHGQTLSDDHAAQCQLLVCQLGDFNPFECGPDLPTGRIARAGSYLEYPFREIDLIVIDKFVTCAV